ncbi:MAG: hypothetical protein AAB479_00165 [Patescibacteria group bacterium]
MRGELPEYLEKAIRQFEEERGEDTRVKEIMVRYCKDGRDSEKEETAAVIAVQSGYEAFRLRRFRDREAD